MACGTMASTDLLLDDLSIERCLHGVFTHNSQTTQASQQEMWVLAILATGSSGRSQGVHEKDTRQSPQQSD